MNINATLIGQSIAFAVFVLFCMKFVWPPVMQALRERQQKIAEGLDAASRAGKDLELAQERAAEQLREAKAEAAQIVEQANRRANQIVEESKVKAQQEADRVKANAEAELEQAVHTARESLRERVGELAILGAETILKSSVDKDRNAELVKNLSSEL